MPSLPEWIIWIHGEREGPYTSQQLRRDARVTAQTLVWKEGMTHPRPLQTVPALAWILPFKTSSMDDVGYGGSLTLQPCSPKWGMLGLVLLVMAILWALIQWGSVGPS
ncbi:MAG: DUF4339 domain-containing protein [Chlamydiia bacterium]